MYTEGVLFSLSNKSKSFERKIRVESCRRLFMKKQIDKKKRKNRDVQSAVKWHFVSAVDKDDKVIVSLSPSPVRICFSSLIIRIIRERERETVGHLDKRYGDNQMD